MTEPKTDNELIAEFMGLVRKEANETYNKAQYYIPVGDKRYKGKFVGYYDTLQYHEFWDWLMPVVEKIHKIQPQAFKIDLFTGPLSPLAKLQIYDPIGVVYKAVVEFIKWYNQQKL